MVPRRIASEQQQRVEAARVRLTEAFLTRRSRDTVRWWTESQAWVDWRPGLDRLRRELRAHAALRKRARAADLC
jgi:hypothetical protein